MAFTREEYNAYLQSDQWKQKKAERLKLDGYRCRMCGKTQDETNLETHHINYRTFGAESVETDLITLCPTCHAAVHRMMCRPTGVWPDGHVRHGWQTDLPVYIREDLRKRGLM